MSRDECGVYDRSQQCFQGGSCKLGQGVQLQGIAMDEEVSLDVGKNPDLPDTSQLAELTEFKEWIWIQISKKHWIKELGAAIKSQMDQADKQALDARGTFEGGKNGD